MLLVFFYPQFKKLTGAERLILKLADYTSRIVTSEDQVVLMTHRFAEECLPALGAAVQLITTGWPLQWTGNHYLDAALEYTLGPALALRIPHHKLSGIIFFGPPSVPAMWFARRVLFPATQHRVPVLYFCFEPPRFIYSDTSDIVHRLGTVGKLLMPLFRAYRALDRRMVHSADMVLANSPYGSRRIWKAYKRRAPVIEHGVDLQSPQPKMVSSLRERYGLDDRPVAITVNHLHPRKRVDLFLRAVHFASHQVSGVTALVIGNGPERDSLERLAHRIGMTPGKDVIFAGSVPEAVLAAHYALADVYVHTGREESFGLSVIEALSLGLPVVSVDEGGPRDTVQDSVSGYLVPATKADLGAALACVISDPERARGMGQAGARFIGSHFKWERGAVTLMGILSLVERRLAANDSRRG